MKDYKRGSHTVWDCKYHLVWTTKHRYQILVGDVGQRCRELLREIAMSKEMHIYAGSINRERAYVNWDTAAAIGLTGGAASEGQEFAQVVIGISGAAQAVLGSAPMGQGVLGGIKWKCDG